MKISLEKLELDVPDLVELIKARMLADAEADAQHKEFVAALYKTAMDVLLKIFPLSSADSVEDLPPAPASVEDILKRAKARRAEAEERVRAPLHQEPPLEEVVP